MRSRLGRSSISHTYFACGYCGGLGWRGEGGNRARARPQYAHAKYLWPARLELLCVSVQRNRFAVATAVSIYACLVMLENRPNMHQNRSQSV